MRAFWVLLFLCVGCIPRPDDAIAIGDLCVPATDNCGSEVVLIRPNVGRNQLDFTLTNTGTETVDVTAFIVNPTVIDFDPNTIDAGDVIAQRVFRDVASGASVSERFTPRLLGTREDLRFLASCDSCSIEVSYVFETVPLECFEDEDCSSDWLCDETVGHCAECLSDDDCNEDQTCDSIRARCTPEDATPSCNVGASPTGTLLIIGLLGLFFVRARKFKLSIPVCVVLLLWSPSAFSSPPSANMSIGSGFRFLTGDLGSDAQRGIGVSLSQELRWKYIGTAVDIGVSFFQTTQQPPPFTRGVQVYRFGIGPRFFLPVSDFDLHLGGEIRRVGFLSNSLVRVTGTETNFTAAAVVTGARFNWERLVFQINAGFAPFFDLPGSMVSIDFAIGFGTLK